MVEESRKLVFSKRNLRLVRQSHPANHRSSL